MNSLYEKVLKPIFFKFDPENVHHHLVVFGRIAGSNAVSRKLINIFYGYKGKDISKTVDGITYKTPFILSAGFDYNAELGNILPEISFGGVEVGSVTARPCEGNPRPRLIRLIKSKSILVNKGLRNDGVETIIKRLKTYKKRKGFVIGVSIARTNDRESSSVESGLEDYLYSFRRLNEENVGDYYTLNISCPNAFGSETFAEPKYLPLLLSKISTIKCAKPVYIKMPISIEWQKFNELLRIIEKYAFVKGLVIGNLNKNYGALDFRDEAPKEYVGGVSGKPCFEPSNNLIRQTRAAYGRRFTIIGCGGVMSPENMTAKFEAGSDLVALVTGIIFNGPGFIKKLANHYKSNASSYE